MTVLPLNDPRHGSHNGYNYYGCRCEICRSFHSDYKHEKRGVLPGTRYNRVRTERICSKDDCMQKHYGRGLCVYHWRETYYPYKPKPRMPVARSERVIVPPQPEKPLPSGLPFAKVKFDPDKARARAGEGIW